ncbi:hypothetical protein CHLNCDRAFT_133312 [Chlorella variabilis]|uniref:Glutamate decarboxylase n=1 Tax=Chlorella variabilis TaxID=554065 RepID=E1Z2U7_CHLVA|nr:hypothetical protein CHLNCDRAFT_133312 [Chlorella variabilis]EFN59728.1 hypothetical protein CHLNCDRAFT_133312 [Chlorella variabilis]|eukprot:XP_005851830.1 hypothetical protein CHLNCDRAFT_133312 [Chlorella variabilis]
MQQARAAVASGGGPQGAQEERQCYEDEELSFIEPVYATRTAMHPAPKHEMPRRTMPAYMAKALVEDMLQMDFNPRLNLSTFLSTWMEAEAQELMVKVAAYNMADAVQYPSAAEMEKRCISFLAKLWHCPDDDFVGTGCVGSSEACYLGGLAMKKKWQQARRAAGLPIDRPNLVLSHVAQVCWQKFCVYFDVEPHYVDVTHDCLVMDPQKMKNHIDENTLGVVVMMGSTYNGQYEPVEEVDRALEEIKKEKGWDIPVHVDAANAGRGTPGLAGLALACRSRPAAARTSAGNESCLPPRLVAPLCQLGVRFDFSLPHVASINVSGHKYGLVYCGVAFQVWRSRAWLPKDMVLTVDYLGKEESNLTVNFSRPGAQIVAQYYNFIRFGKAGYRRMFDNLFAVCCHLAAKLEETGHFEILSTGDVPVLAFRLKPLTTALGLENTYNEYE